MRLLLDTHAFIWMFDEPEKLSPKAHTLLADSNNELIVSVVSVWEMQIKMKLGKLRLTVPPGELVESHRQTNGVQVLPVELGHVLALDALPAHHKDPFDPLLVAQANVEGASLVSRDPLFSGYPVQLLW
jgi:PIN domain nuclease of toxin-antitoxin system